MTLLPYMELLLVCIHLVLHQLIKLKILAIKIEKFCAALNSLVGIVM